MSQLQQGYILRGAERAYRIEGVLGQGGFGITYKASAVIKVGNIDCSVPFAIKELFLKDCCERDTHTFAVTYSNPVKQRVENSKTDFIAEARRLASISHPNIVRVNEVIEANNTAYYVMEFLNGESLSQYVNNQGSLSEEETMRLVIPIINAVQHIHDRRITHLDIKPANVMLKRTNGDHVVPVLIDFGLSKHYDEEGKPTSTIRTQGLSDGYAPIEQYAGLDTFSPQADVYALGATLFFCLTGKRPPRAGELQPQTIDESLPTSINVQCRKAITHAMQYMQHSRTATAQALLSELNCIDTNPIPGPIPEPDPVPDTIDLLEFAINCVDEFGKKISNCEIRLKYPVEGVYIDDNNKCHYQSTTSQSIMIMVTCRGYQNAVRQVYLDGIPPHHTETIKLHKLFNPEPPKPIANSNKGVNHKLVIGIIALVVLLAVFGIVLWPNSDSQTDVVENEEIVAVSDSTTAIDLVNHDISYIKNNDVIDITQLKTDDFKTLVEYIANGDIAFMCSQMERCYGAITGNDDINSYLRQIYIKISELKNAGKHDKVEEFGAACRKSSIPQNGSQINLSELLAELNKITEPKPSSSVTPVKTVKKQRKKTTKPVKKPTSGSGTNTQLKHSQRLRKSNNDFAL